MQRWGRRSNVRYNAMAGRQTGDGKVTRAAHQAPSSVVMEWVWRYGVGPVLYLVAVEFMRASLLCMVLKRWKGEPGRGQIAQSYNALADLRVTSCRPSVCEVVQMSNSYAETRGLGMLVLIIRHNPLASLTGSCCFLLPTSWPTSALTAGAECPSCPHEAWRASGRTIW
jgi:hypothetical protein